MYWSHFINLALPTSKPNDYVRKASRDCYVPLLEIIEAHPRARITVNIDGSLAERLRDLGASGALEGLRRLAERGQVELTASAYGGPVLGTLPAAEIKAAVRRNTEALRGFFGDAYRPAGFFPPEMSYQPSIAPIVHEMGYRWIVLDEMAHTGKPGTIKADRVYVMEGMPDLKVVFRDRSMSTGILYGSFEDADSFMKARGWHTDERSFVLTGTEADIYGMRRTGPKKFLVDMTEKQPATMVTVSEALGLMTKVEPVKPVPASWSTWDTLAF